MAVARLRAEAALGDGSAFGNLSSEAQQAKDDYEAQTYAQNAASWSAALQGKTTEQQKSLLDHEVPDNATYQSDPLPTGQPQHVYHFQDGTLIRLKPDGDDKNGPKAGYSVEVAGVLDAAERLGLWRLARLR